jgi:hypothetical protein
MPYRSPTLRFTRTIARLLRALAAIGIVHACNGLRFRRDLSDCLLYWAGRRMPPGPIRPGYGALNFQNVPLVAPSK